MLLKFNITWTAYVWFPFPAAPQLKGDYSYSIDDGPRVTIEANQSANDEIIYHPNGNFTKNPSFSYSMNVSSLTNGYHKIVIIVGLYRTAGNYYINKSTIPIQFQVQNSQTQQIPEFPHWLTLPLFLIATFSIIAARKKISKFYSQY
jgi:hypothetical protein